ncbi:transglutaminase superfamily protein [Ulvibacter sp. MAR_2010_11]|uniref:transglutaminase domain-containing protein n=1 Tax=Ulvibacter sp. MAR_2010_11 TaxID=1250229 RepID=UPI000CA85CFC|nr:transglutaminase domain-containing protein [Ulvibacter sp. MAR_2010_11]PKA82699.1 transglutaminase superfamily protein [Ulvibacter sp. MAR_2010_11]
MKKNAIFIFFICLFVGAVQITTAQRNVIGAREAPKATNSTANLARNITKYSTTDLEKAGAIFNWIAKNISYDYELSNSAKLQKEFYTSEANVIKKTLERKKALCGGYAFLFKDLCKEVGISSEVIHGYSKKYDISKSSKKVNHSWNAVKIDGKWHLLDITMARSHGKTNTPDTFWFLTKPQSFILTHFPENTRWTLLANPISKEEFEKLPTH